MRLLFNPARYIGKSMNHFKLHKLYRTTCGKLIAIVGESNDKGKAYRCVLGNDGKWRYDRPGDYGQVTGTNHNFSCPDNLVDTFVTEGERADGLKATTKVCPVCGNTNLGLLSTYNLKVCTNHKKFVYIPWFIDEGRVPIYGNSKIKE